MRLNQHDDCANDHSNRHHFTTQHSARQDNRSAKKMDLDKNILNLVELTTILRLHQIKFRTSGSVHWICTLVKLLNNIFVSKSVLHFKFWSRIIQKYHGWMFRKSAMTSFSSSELRDDDTTEPWMMSWTLRTSSLVLMTKPFGKSTWVDPTALCTTSRLLPELVADVCECGERK